MDVVGDQLEQASTSFEEIWAGDFKAVFRRPLPDDVIQLLQTAEKNLSRSIRRVWRTFFSVIRLVVLIVVAGAIIKSEIVLLSGVCVFLLSALIPLFGNAFSNTGQRTRIRNWLDADEVIHFQMEFKDIEDAENRWFDEFRESDRDRARRFGIIRGGWFLHVEEESFEISNPGFDFVRSESEAELRSETRPWRIEELSIEGKFQQVPIVQSDRAEIELYMKRLRIIAWILTASTIASIAWIVLSFTYREAFSKLPSGGGYVAGLLAIWTFHRIKANRERFNLLSEILNEDFDADAKRRITYLNGCSMPS